MAMLQKSYDQCQVTFSLHMIKRVEFAQATVSPEDGTGGTRRKNDPRTPRPWLHVQLMNNPA